MREPSPAPAAAYLPDSRLPTWGVADLPNTSPVGLRNWRSYLGPGIVMCGIALAGGEWLVGPDITARYGGGLMWICTIAIACQVFYNAEVGRYALATGEPILTGFMRAWPGPTAWICLILALSVGSFIPAMSTNAASIVVAAWLDRPPLAADAWLVKLTAYVLLGIVTLPILTGGKVYNTLQVIFTVKVVGVLGFCTLVGLTCVSAENWMKIMGGFLKFGTVPTKDALGNETAVNLFVHWFRTGSWPTVSLENIALLGAFAGYAGGGGMSNSTYGNYVRDKGWGMGGCVGAIPSLVGGRSITLSHIGKVFPLTAENLRRWRVWWTYILCDQCFIWVPGCIMGMALPGLLSLQFAAHSTLYAHKADLDWAQALITADGIRHGITTPALAELLWLATLVVGMLVLLPSQLAVVEEFARRWTDILWSGTRFMRERVPKDHIKTLYYGLLFFYLGWTYFCAWLFNTYGSPKLMALVIANLNNVALGGTAFVVLYVNRRFLPPPLRPGWLPSLGLVACGVFYLGLAALVFVAKQWPVLKGLIGF